MTRLVSRTAVPLRTALLLVSLPLFAASTCERPVDPTLLVATVAVAPKSATINVNQQLTLIATLLDANRMPLSGRPITWSSDDTTVASVDTEGLVTGLGKGAATVSAASEGRIGTARVSVRGPLETLLEKLATLRWIAYAPTNFDPNNGVFPDTASIRADLEVAYQYGFSGVVTFGADGTLAEIPRIAKEVGFQGVIMGLFMFDERQRQEELPNARAAAEFVDGYVVGNEGLIGCGGEFYSATTLVATMDELRAVTGKPVTTSEQIEDYLDGGCLCGFLLTNGDWLFPIVHPFNNVIRDPDTAVAFTVNRIQGLDGLTDKTVCAKETGWPTEGDPAATEENQETYFSLLKQESVCYVYFEAFDQPWKTASLWEPFWGLFREDRSAKLFISRNQP